MKKSFIGSLNEDQLAGRLVLVRVDFNVPLLHVAKGRPAKIENDARIRGALPTIRYLKLNKAKIVLCSHLGRPNGQRDESLSLAPIAARLSELLDGDTVHFATDCIGIESSTAVAALRAGEVLLLENLRFHAEEEDNDPKFASQLARGVDIFVNDAFGAAHRAHASTEGVTHFVPRKFAGFLMRDELLYLGSALDHPHRPFAAVIGGAKVSSKIEVLLALLSKVDKLLIGGGMVYTFYRAMGHSVGDSLVEDEHLKTADRILKLAAERKVQLALAQDSLISPTTVAVHPRRALKSSVPLTGAESRSALEASQKGSVPENVLVGEGAGTPSGESKSSQRTVEGPQSLQHVPFAEDAEELGRLGRDLCRVASNKAIPDGWVGVDIGAETVLDFNAQLDGCRTILWNGPMGMFENPLYATGTNAVMSRIAQLSRDEGVTSVVCGGETVSAVEGSGLKGFKHVSTGGGAALEYIAGNVLPGVQALDDERNGN